MAESLTDLLAREYEYLRRREGRDFFLDLSRYVAALDDRRRLRKIIGRLERDAIDALSRFVEEENAVIDEAMLIRRELAEVAPEIDNSDMERPDDPSELHIKPLAGAQRIEQIIVGVEALRSTLADIG